jgi:hypothetical protein
MRRYAFFVFMLLFCIIFNQFVSAEITDNSITGKITSQQVGLNIFVRTIIPYIQITSPKNQTYLTNESIFLNYTLVNGDYVWYNLDNSDNITINSSVQFNVSQGLHTLYIFANNSNDTVTSNTSFTANSSKFIILFENYKNSTKGSSTNFLNYSYEEIQSLNNIILENTVYGKIEFNKTINMTDDKVFTDNLLDIDSNIKISSNHIEVNTEELPNFNKSATLWLYNLTFTNPRILKDGVVCPSSLCIKESYNYPSGSEGGTLKFNVTGFSVYSAEETPATETVTVITTTGGGGGGGGGISAPASKYSISTKEILVYLKQGETTTKYFTIENKDNKKLNLKINTTSIENLILINETEISLEPGESKTIRLDFLAKEDTLPNLYLGKITISTAGTEKEILVMIEIESKNALFDVKMKIPDKFLYVLPGEEISAQIQLYNLGYSGRMDVSLDYIIKNSKGEDILLEQDSTAVETSTSFIKNIKLPENLAFGKYVFYTKVTYNDKVASASAWFNVGKEPTINLKTGIMALIIVLAIGTLIIIIRIRKIKEHSSISKKIDISSLKRAKITKE